MHVLVSSIRFTLSFIYLKDSKPGEAHVREERYTHLYTISSSVST